MKRIAFLPKGRCCLKMLDVFKSPSAIPTLARKIRMKDKTEIPA